MADLPTPQFVDKLDLPTILAECIAQFEADAGRPLEPAQVERIIVDLIAYREQLTREQVQQASLQNLWRFARYPMIDFLAELLDESRLDAKPATAPFTFTLAASQGVDMSLVAGTLIRSSDGKATFATDAEHVFLAGQTVLEDVMATCNEAGVVGNGYVAGQVTDLVNGFAVAMTVTNTDTTNGGAPQETTDRMRARVPGTVRAFSCAGPDPAYVYFSLRASVDVLDVDVTTPTPGTVQVTLLIDEGADVGTVTSLVTSALNDEDVRPMTDTVVVTVATPVDYALAATIVLAKGAEWSDVQPLLAAAWSAYQASRSVTLGTAPVVSQIYKALMIDGVDSVTLTSPGVVIVPSDQWARCTSVTFSFGGFAS